MDRFEEVEHCDGRPERRGQGLWIDWCWGLGYDHLGNDSGVDGGSERSNLGLTILHQSEDKEGRLVMITEACVSAMAEVAAETNMDV